MMMISSPCPTSGGNQVEMSSCMIAFCTVAPTPPPTESISLRYDSAPDPSP